MEELDINSFAFRYACYKEFGWTPEQVDLLNESEAFKIAITLTEEARYQRKKQREAERGQGHSGGLQQGFEQDFEFGNEPEEDTNYTPETQWNYNPTREPR